MGEGKLPREWWIKKGDSNFTDNKDSYDDDTYHADDEQFYDLISADDKVGKEFTHVIEAAPALAELQRLKTELAEAREILSWYGDDEKMYDCAFDNDGKTIGYVRGVDQYDITESDFEIIEGKRIIHHGKRARAFLQKYSEGE